MAVVEKVFYTEKKEIFNSDSLKLIGFKYEGASTLDMEKEGYYFVIKADEDIFEKNDVKEILKNAKEVKGDEKEKVLAKFKEVEENTASGFAMFD